MDVRRPGGRRPGQRVAVALGVVLLLGLVSARLFVWPSLPDLPEHVDAIVELAGPGNRDAVAMALGEAHVAPLVIQSTVPGDTACLPPIARTTIECFTPTPSTTRGEARYVGERGAEDGWGSVVIVTTPDHALRARWRVERCFPGKVYVATSPLPAHDWLVQIPYQWAATAKAQLFERDC